jgi:hypothetical protein
LHPITIRRWMNLGKLAAVRVRIEARIPRSEIGRLLGQTDELLVLSDGGSGFCCGPPVITSLCSS